MSTNLKPQVEIPADQPPSYQLELDNLTIGEGDEAVAARVVEVQYVGVSWSSGEIGPDETLVFVVDLMGVR